MLFRGKYKDRWFKGYYICAKYHWHNKGIHEDWIITGASQNGGWFVINGRYPIDKKSLSQYTGYKAYNNNLDFVTVRATEPTEEIYVNDIIGVWCHGEMFPYRVVYHRGAFMIKGRYGSPSLLASVIDNPNEQVFLLGNIIDDPELHTIERWDED